MAYSTVQDVLKAAGLGMTVTTITKLHESEMTDDQVSTMIEEWIAEADEAIQEALEVPMVVRDEVHVADGETSEFPLGPQDEEHYTVSKTVQDNLVKVIKVNFGCYKKEYKKFPPYPTDCDSEYTESAAAVVVWNATASNCLASREVAPSFIKAGDASIKYVFSAAGYSRYTLDDKNIDQYEYVAFAFRTDDETTTFTLSLIEEDGTYTSQEFTVKRADTMYIVWMRIDNMTGTVDWDSKKLRQISLASDKACTCYMDMLNFNHGYCWSAPQGYLYIHEAENAGEDPPTEGYGFWVTYEYDPYLSSTPVLVRRASKYFAAADLVEHLVGLRQSQTAFEAQGDTGIPTKESLLFNMGRLRKMGQTALDSLGYGWAFSPIKG